MEKLCFSIPAMDNNGFPLFREMARPKRIFQFSQQHLFLGLFKKLILVLKRRLLVSHNKRLALFTTVVFFKDFGFAKRRSPLFQQVMFERKCFVSVTQLVFLAQYNTFLLQSNYLFLVCFKWLKF